VPLQRDEGEYAYAGQLILEGIPPYKEVYNMKMPGIYAAYALIMAIFGQTGNAIHLGLLLINSATIILIFLLGKRLFDTLTGVISAASFAILSLGLSVQGVFANAEHFVILAAAGGALLLLKAVDSDRRAPLFWSGLLFGTAFIIKQHGGAFLLFGLLFILSSQIDRRPIIWPRLSSKILSFIGGAIIPFGLTSLFFLKMGLFERFWFWTFIYAREYVSLTPILSGLRRLSENMAGMINSSSLIWAFAGIGLITLFWDKRVRGRSVFIQIFFISSFLSICPGFYFRPHYSILLLPAIALLTGIGINSMGRKRKIIPIILTLIVLSYSIYQQRAFFFELSPRTVSRLTYGFNPFPDSPEIARYIREHSSKDERVAVLGSEPQIYFYSKRHSATGYIYAYPLMEDHRYALSMQKEAIREIESKKPKFIIFVNIPTSWLRNQQSERLIFDWFNKYSKKYYKRVGVVDIVSPKETIFRWDDDSLGYTPRSSYWIFVYSHI